MIDASPAAITLALLRTDEGVGLVGEEGWRWRNRGARTIRRIRCRKPSTGCAPWGAYPRIPRQCLDTRSGDRTSQARSSVHSTSRLTRVSLPEAVVE